MKKNNGITLIALIITIIVLLILVAVSVQILIKSNLMGAAEKATGKYKTASEEEANGGTVEIDDKKYDSLDDYLKEKEMTDEVHDWKRTGDNLTCNHCNVTLTIGQELNYKDNGVGTSSISAEKASGYTEEETTAIINNGIKLASLNVNTTLTIAASGPSKPTTTQTISKDNDTKWVVLGVEDSNKNGTNETLLITTKTPTTGEITLYGAAAYNNAVEEINRMCKELYGEEARGMTIEDVNNCLQYTPTGGMYEDASGYRQINNLTTKLSDLPTWNAIKDNHKTPDGKDTEENFGNVLLNGYYYYVSNDGTYLVNDANKSDTSNVITTATKDTIFGTSEDYYYWLASKGVYAKSSWTEFGLGTVWGSSAYSYRGLFYSNSYAYVNKLSLRAVVPLRSDIPAL